MSFIKKQNKQILHFLGLALLISITSYFFMTQPQFIGFMSLETSSKEIVNNTGICGGWQLAGGCRDDYNVTVENLGGTIRYEYKSGTDLNFSYLIKGLNDGCGLRSVYYNFSYKGDWYYGSLGSGSINILFPDGEKKDSDASWNVLRYGIDEKGHTYCSLNISSGGGWIIANYTYYPEGMSLVTEVEEVDRHNVSLVSWSIGWGHQYQSETYPEFVYNRVISYSQGYPNFNSFTKINNKIFVNIVPEIKESYGSKIGIWDSNAGSGNINWNRYIDYYNLTNGSQNKLKERAYQVVSNQVGDVLLSQPSNNEAIRSKLGGKVIFEIWNKVDDEGVLGFEELKEYFNKFYNYGFEDLIINDGDWRGDNNPWPDGISNGFNSDSINLSNYISNNLSWEYIPYVIYQDVYPDSRFYSQGYLMQNSNGDYITSYSTAKYSKYDKRKEIAEYNIINISNKFNNSGFFIDAIVIKGLTAGLDMNRSSYQHGISWRGYEPTVELVDYARMNNSKYIFSEGGGSRPEFMTVVDGFEGTQKCCNNDISNTVVPDRFLTKVRPYTYVYGGYYRRAFDCDNHYKGCYYGINFTQEDYDRYFVIQNAVFGNGCMIDNVFPWLHNVSDKYVINYYYMCKELSKKTHNYTSVSVRYYNGSEWVSLTEIMKQNQSFDFYNPAISINYSNGLMVYANLGTRNVTIDGYTLTKNSAYAKNSSNFKMLYNIDGDYFIESPEYIYILPNSESSFSFKSAPYKAYNFSYALLNEYSSDSGRKLERTFVSSNITTDHQTVLLRDSSITIYCGDDICNNNESCSTCPSDCGTCNDTSKPVFSNILVSGTYKRYNNITISINVTDPNLEYIWLEHNNSITLTNTSYKTISNYQTQINISLKKGNILSFRIHANDSYYNLNSTSWNSITIQDSEITSRTINNISFDEDTQKTINLSEYFNDRDEETINYSYISPLIVNINNSIATVSAPQNWNGISHLTFIANNITSNNITITVNPVADCGIDGCEAGEDCNNCPSDCGSCTTASSGGGGGGGTPKTTAKTWYEVKKDEEVTFKIKDKENPVMKLKFVPSKDTKNMNLKVNTLQENPVQKAPSEEVYQYLQVDIKNSPEVKKGTFEFKVSKTWLKNKNPDDIAMFRYKNSKWNELPTEITGKDSKNIYYKAETPGFSYFSIALKQSKKAEIQKPSKVIKHESIEVPETARTPEIKTKSSILDMITKNFWMGVSIACTILLMLIAILVFQKSRI